MFLIVFSINISKNQKQYKLKRKKKLCVFLDTRTHIYTYIHIYIVLSNLEYIDSYSNARNYNYVSFKKKKCNKIYTYIMYSYNIWMKWNIYKKEYLNENGKKKKKIKGK